METLLSAKNIYYERTDREFFHGLSFSVAAGSVCQIQGPNGVGKTTLLRLLSGFIPITKGKIECHTSRAYIGHQPGLTSGLTVTENLNTIAKLYGQSLSQIQPLLIQFGLIDQQIIYTNSLSAGQQRRLAFAALLLTSAKLWLLDEPLSSLDNHARMLIHSIMIKHLNQNGAIILTTHQPLNWENYPVQEIILQEKQSTLCADNYVYAK